MVMTVFASGEWYCSSCIEMRVMMSFILCFEAFIDAAE